MTKADIVDEIAERTGLTKKDVADTVDQFLEAVSRALAAGKHIEIRGFGTFKVKDRKSRLARNPRTGESVPVPPRRVPGLQGVEGVEGHRRTDLTRTIAGAPVTAALWAKGNGTSFATSHFRFS
jgi:nucleoid DNA-binding protein